MERYQYTFATKEAEVFKTEAETLDEAVTRMNEYCKRGYCVMYEFRGMAVLTFERMLLGVRWEKLCQ